MKRHKKEHEQGAYPCDICQKVFKKQVNLRLHRRRHKNDPPVNELFEQVIAENFDMTCDHCDVKFISYNEARQHYKDIHNGWLTISVHT